MNKFDIITIDFETYYDDEYTLSKMTTLEYVRDPRFDVLSVSVKINGGKSEVLTHEQFKRFVASVPWESVAVNAHHAHFEGLILRERFGVVRVGFWIDTLSMARCLYSGEIGASLAKVAPYLGGGRKLEMPPVKGLHYDQVVAAGLWPALVEYNANDTDEQYRIFRVMLADFPSPAKELRVIDYTIRMYTEPFFRIDEALLSEYADWEDRRRDELLARMGLTEKDFRSRDKFAAILRSQGVEPPLKRALDKYKRPKVNDDGSPKMTYAFAKDDVGMQILLDHEDETIRELCAAKLLFSSTMRQTRSRRLLWAGKGGLPVPVYLKPYAAHTGRWGGGDKTNFQNFDRVKRRKNPETKKEEMIPNTGMLRRALIAPPGYSIVVADSAQIEARKNAWHSGQADIVEAFAAKRDIYSEFASTIYMRMIDRKKNADDFIPGFVGKTCILGLGYGMGWPKFAFEMLKGALGGPPVQFKQHDMEMLNVNFGRFVNNPRNIEKVKSIISRLDWEALLVHCAVCWEIVNRYRGRSDRIVGFWEICDQMIPKIWAGREDEFGPNGIYKVTQGAIILPSGRKLKYPNLHKGKDGWSYTDPETHEVKKLYGGKVCENVTQAVCRDIVAWQGIEVSKFMFLATTTHDELVGGIETHRAQWALDRTIEIMSVSPDYAPGLPLLAEGGWGQSYGEIK